MIISVYDYLDNEKKITLPDKEIAYIYVSVRSGDETGWVQFTDGERVMFDASDDRHYDFFDGEYWLMGEDIKKWLDFVSGAECGTVSYERLSVFTQEDD